MMSSISDIIAEWRREPWFERAMEAGASRDRLPEAGVMAAMAHPEILHEAVNLGALAAAWWHTPRDIWRLKPATAAAIAATGVAFVPEDPPAAWHGRAIIAEGGGQCELVAGMFSAGAYITRHQSGEPWYYVVALGLNGSALIAGLPCAQRRINEAMAKSGELLGDLPAMIDGQHIARLGSEQRVAVVRVLQFLLALGYYVAEPVEGVTVARPQAQQQSGRGKRGKMEPIWRYRGLDLHQAAGDPEPESAPLTGLELRPALVRQHWRRHPTDADRAVLVRGHLSQRWRRGDVLGTKKTI